jgi:hypothetical protein
MFLRTGSWMFDPATGAPTKWFSYVAGNYRLFDHPGFDPIYGLELTPVTPEVARRVEGTTDSTEPDLPGPYFDPVTGAPLRWYYRWPDGRIELFTSHGFHPLFGDSLRIIDRSIAEEFHRQASRLRAQERPSGGDSGSDTSVTRSDQSTATDAIGIAHLPPGVVRGTPSEVEWGVACIEACPSERKRELLQLHSLRSSCSTVTAVRVDERGYPKQVATLTSSGELGCDRAQEAWMAEARWESRGHPYWLAYRTTIAR